MSAKCLYFQLTIFPLTIKDYFVENYFETTQIPCFLSKFHLLILAFINNLSGGGWIEKFKKRFLLVGISESKAEMDQSGTYPTPRMLSPTAINGTSRYL